MQKNKVIIIGAGISGLTAAYYLKKQDIPFLILEKEGHIGGRVQTVEEDGYLFDVGFQVFLDAYPEAQKILDYKTLNLRNFEPGAYIKWKSRMYAVVDPTRKPSKILAGLFSPVGTLSDKIKVLKLRYRLKNKSVDSIFSQVERSTSDVLTTEYGFSSSMINRFFKPFFSGIFFENELKTSCRMFDFVYKMFTVGNACLPAKGIAAIPNQLADSIGRENIRLNSEVKGINNNKVTLDNNEELEGALILLSTSNSSIYKATNLDFLPQWQGVFNFYFSCTTKPLNQAMIALNANPNKLVCTVAVPSMIAPDYAPKGKHLISVTVLSKGSEKTDEIKLYEHVRKELAALFKNTKDWEYLKVFKIPMALPNQEHVTDEISWEYIRRSNTLFICGDYLMNGSLNAAMKSGRLAAHAIARELGLKKEDGV